MAGFFVTAKFAKKSREGRKGNPKWKSGGSFPQDEARNVHPTLTEKIHSPMIGPKYGAVWTRDGCDDQ